MTHVYRWNEPDGTAVISNIAPPSSVTHYSIQKIDSPTLSAGQRAAAASRLAKYRAALANPEAPAVDDIAVARDRLEHARRERDIGREPLPGERLHNAHGGSRLSPLYFRRQAKLESALAAAQAQLNEAYRERSEALQ